MRKLTICAAIALLLVFAWLNIYGINKTIDETISVDVYEDNDWSYVTSSITISGNLRKTLFSTSYVGIFAIDYYELSCREGVEAKIEWDNGYSDILFYYAGNFSRFDIEKIDINQDMHRMMIVFNDGTIITTPNYYIPISIWNQYKS